MSNSNSLDFSDYPTIAHPSPEEEAMEVERRSEGIKVIKEIMENLVKAMHSYLADLSDLDGKASMLDQQRAELVEMDKQIRFSHHELEKKEQGIDEQFKFIDVRNKELKEQELKIQTEKEEHSRETDATRRELEGKEKTINEKLSKLPEVEASLKELQDRQTALDNLASIDRERKTLLDAREEKILQREARIERIEAESKVG